MVFVELLNASSVFCQWEPDVRLTNAPGISYPSYNNARGNIAVSGDAIHTVWFDNRGGNYYAIYYKRSTDRGLNWGADIALTDGIVTGALYPSIAVAGNIVHVVWHSELDNGFEICYKQSEDGGLTWTTDIRLTEAPLFSGYPSLAVSGNMVHITWYDERDGNYEIYYKRIAVFLSMRYTEPIHNVVDAARKVAAGDFSQNLAVDRKDEIGELTESFNFMVRGLRENRELEDRTPARSRVPLCRRTALPDIAHEIRNPLNFISLGIDHIRKKFRPSGGAETEDFASLVASIKQEIQRLNRLVTDFLDYGKPLKLNLQRTNITQMLRDVVEIVKAKADSERISVTEEYAYSPELRLDPELVKTCVLNVMVNSFQAMPEAGTLAIRTGRDNGSFLLEISDTGIGVPRENLPKLFEPFFTTKNDGLVLGLATTKRIIEEHGGKIAFRSSEAW